MRLPCLDETDKARESWRRIIGGKPLLSPPPPHLSLLLLPSLHFLLGLLTCISLFCSLSSAALLLYSLPHQCLFNLFLWSLVTDCSYKCECLYTSCGVCDGGELFLCSGLVSLILLTNPDFAEVALVMVSIENIGMVGGCGTGFGRDF